MNVFNCIGNLTRDPEVKYLNDGTAVCNFSLALNRKWKDKKTGDMKEEVAYVDMVAWGKTAELAGEYLKKGNKVGISSTLEQQTWEDKETGAKRSKIVFRVNEMTFLGNNGGASSSGDAGDDSQPAQKRAPKQQQKSQEPEDSGSGDPDEIPF